jgi:polar amino acid transport system substrate-binding protein
VKAIKIVTVRDVAPFISQTGNDPPVGLDVDLMNEIGKLYQIAFTYQYAEFSQLIPLVQNNEDMISISSQTDTLAREQLVNFAHFFRTGTGFLVLSTYAGTINRLADLCGKNVAVVTSTIQEKDVNAQSAKCGASKITILSFLTYTEARDAVRSGAAEVALDDQAANAAVVKMSNGQFKEVGQPYDIQPFGIVCNKQNDKMCCALVNAINYLINKGTYEQILNKYSYSYENNGVCPSRVNLNGTTCLSKCMPSDSECQKKLSPTTKV